MCFQVALQADFQEPVRIGAPDREVGSFQVGLDFFENVNLAYEQDEEVLLDTRMAGSSFTVTVGKGGEPSLAFNSLGVFVAYSSEDSGEGTGRRIFVRSRLGGAWKAAERFSSPPGDDRSPALRLWGGQVAVVAWEKRIAGGTSQVWFRRGDGEEVNMGPGEQPALLLDKVGRAHVFFLRDGDIFHAREKSTAQPGVFSDPVNLTNSPAEKESRPSVAIGPDQTLILCFSRAGDVLLADDSSGQFAPPEPVAEGGSRNPSLALLDTGAMSVAFEKDGDIHYTLGTSFFLPETVPVTRSPERESDPVVLLDSFASLVVAFKRQGALYYATNAGIPQARFHSEPTSGRAPLEVSFQDESTGAITGWSWDFGDGTTSGDRNPIHVFRVSGEYLVSLRVSGPGGESPVAHRATIRVLDPTNEMHLEDVMVFPGQRGVYVPVRATHDQPSQGFTVAATYDPAVIEVKTVDFIASNIVGLQPELFAVTISDDPGDSYVTAGILFDMAAPFDGRELEPGTNYRVANLVIDVRRDAAPGTTTRIELRNQLGHPPLSNIITVKGFSVLPVLGDGGRIAVSHLSFPPPRFFLRGDTNGDRAVNLTDAVHVLNYLFSGGVAPSCHDAADAGDDGRIDISDAVFVLNFLFKSGIYPPPPYPEPGMDPTDDKLPPCLLR